MKLKKYILTSLILMYFSCLLSQEKYARIVVYRNEISKTTSNEGYKIFADENLTTILNNYSFEEFYMPSGTFKLKVNEIFPTTCIVNSVAGKTFYYRINRNFDIPEKPVTIVLVDSAIAVNDLRLLKKVSVSSHKIIKKKIENGVGFSIEPGVGFEKIGLIGTSLGTQVMHSFGGGVLFALKYSRYVNDFFGFTTSLSHQFSMLTPSVTNADVKFTQGVVSFSPFFLVPLIKKKEMRIKLGGGVDYRFNPILNIETEELTNGFNDKWTYKSTIGYHLYTYFVGKISENVKIHAGFKYNDARFRYIFGEKFIPGNEMLLHPHANSLGLSIGLEYCF